MKKEKEESGPTSGPIKAQRPKLSLAEIQKKIKEFEAFIESMEAEMSSPRSTPEHRTRFLHFQDTFQADEPEALKAIEEAVELARQDGDASAVRLYRHWRLQAWIHIHGDLSRALPEAIDLVSDIQENEPGHESRACSILDLLLCHLMSDPAGSLAGCKTAALKTIQELPLEHRCRGCITGALAWAHAKTGDGIQARVTFDEASPVLPGHVREYFQNNLPSCLVRAGEYEQAAALLPDAIARVERRGETSLAAYLRLDLALCFLRMGRLDEALPLLEQGRVAGERLFGTPKQWWLHEVQAEFEYASGNLHHALSLQEMVIRERESMGHLHDAARLAARRVEMAHARQSSAAAERRASASIDVERLESEAARLRSRLEAGRCTLR